MRFFIFILLLLLPVGVFAAEGDFVSLVSIPNVNYNSDSLVEYINSIFTLVISLAAMLAVLRVITGGFQYMTSEALGAKSEARETIQGAVFGLILLVGSWLILYTVNPQILDLSGLKFQTLQFDGDPVEALNQQRLEGIVGESNFSNGRDAQNLASRCKTLGGTPSEVKTTNGECEVFSNREGYCVRYARNYTVTCSK